ncbi:hypothetical protein HDU76_000532, partial [Blyttiomyces sp. JEL0837]
MTPTSGLGPALILLTVLAGRSLTPVSSTSSAPSSTTNSTSLLLLSAAAAAAGTRPHPLTSPNNSTNLLSSLSNSSFNMLGMSWKSASSPPLMKNASNMGSSLVDVNNGTVTVVDDHDLNMPKKTQHQQQQQQKQASNQINPNSTVSETIKAATKVHTTIYSPLTSFIIGTSVSLLASCFSSLGICLQAAAIAEEKRRVLVGGGDGGDDGEGDGDDDDLNDDE